MVVAKALEQRGISRPVVMVAVVVDSVSYYAAYVPALALAVLITVREGHASRLIVAAALLFVIFSAALTAAALVLSGRSNVGPNWLKRIPLLKCLLELLGQADPNLSRSIPLIFKSGLFQLAIVLLDVATLWVLTTGRGGGLR